MCYTKCCHIEGATNNSAVSLTFRGFPLLSTPCSPPPGGIPCTWRACTSGRAWISTTTSTQSCGELSTSVLSSLDSTQSERVCWKFVMLVCRNILEKNWNFFEKLQIFSRIFQHTSIQIFSRPFLKNIGIFLEKHWNILEKHWNILWKTLKFISKKSIRADYHTIIVPGKNPALNAPWVST